MVKGINIVWHFCVFLFVSNIWPIFFFPFAINANENRSLSERMFSDFKNYICLFDRRIPYSTQVKIKLLADPLICVWKKNILCMFFFRFPSLIQLTYLRKAYA